MNRRRINRVGFTLFFLATSLSSMATLCGCPDANVLFVDRFEDCDGEPCGWSADAGSISSEGGLRLLDGTTARRAVSVEFGREEFWSAEFSVRCEAAGSVRFDASGPEPIVLNVVDDVADGGGDEAQRVRVDLVPEEYGLFIVDEIAFTSVGGACTVEDLFMLSQMYCD